MRNEKKNMTSVILEASANLFSITIYKHKKDS
jgi:hypothetical protein